MPNNRRKYRGIDNATEIWLFNEPTAGQIFKFKVTGIKRPFEIQIEINDEILKSRICEDPPCHEQVHIPRNTEGSRMKIVVFADKKINLEEYFVVRGEGHSSLAQVEYDR